MTQHDAVVVGAGPNGLAAAVRLAHAGRDVLLLEADDTVGGGCRSAELTQPGFVHDVCSAIHPLAASSPFFSALPLEDHGLEWIQPEAPLAHPLDDGTAVVLEREVEATGVHLDPDDADRWRKLVGPFADQYPALIELLLTPPAVRLPRHLLLGARFGPLAIRSAEGLANARLSGPRARALFAGCAAHSFLPLDALGTAGFGLMMGVSGHAVGWPFPAGGSQAIADALASVLREHGATIETGVEVTTLDELPPADSILLDVTPRQLIAITGDRLPVRARRRFERFRYGPGVFKVDYALSEPVPWTAPGAGRAATLHLGGTFEQLAAGEADVAAGRHPDRPFVLVAQHSRFDPSRAPDGKHTVWAYCHVPHGSDVDMTETIDNQIERFAPGFRDLIMERHTMNSRQLESYNANYVGGDISGGASGGLQLMPLRPRPSLHPYATGIDGVWLCSSSTAPGSGVHGMCGYHAADAALAAAGVERPPYAHGGGLT